MWCRQSFCIERRREVAAHAFVMSRKKHTCRLCHTPGHNRASCPHKGRGKQRLMEAVGVERKTLIKAKVAAKKRAASASPSGRGRPLKRPSGTPKGPYATNALCSASGEAGSRSDAGGLGLHTGAWRRHAGAVVSKGASRGHYSLKTKVKGSVPVTELRDRGGSASPEEDERGKAGLEIDERDGLVRRWIKEQMEHWQQVLKNKKPIPHIVSPENEVTAGKAPQSIQLGTFMLPQLIFWVPESWGLHLRHRNNVGQRPTCPDCKQSSLAPNGNWKYVLLVVMSG